MFPGTQPGRTKTLLQLVKPKYFIPVHGSTAICSGTRRWRISWDAYRMKFCLWKTGGRSNLQRKGAAAGAGDGGRVCVDSGSLEEIEEVVIRDRKHLSEDGIVVPIIAIDKHTGKMESHPEIVSRD